MNWNVRAARRRDIRPLAKALARAFYTEPAMSWMLPDADTRLRRLEIMFATVLRWLYLPLGATEIALRDGQVTAGAVWRPPARQVPVWRTALAAPGMLRAMGRRLKAGRLLMETLERHHPREPHWYLVLIGTDPSTQGQGAGGALLRSQLARCDAAGEAAYLETADPSNVGRYERFGFEVIQEIAIPESAPAQWGMWRKPR